MKHTTTVTGQYQVRVMNDDANKLSRLDITVTPDTATNPNPTAAGGRVSALSMAFDAGAFTESASTDADYYILTPGGFSGTNYVWKLDLNNFAGFIYEIVANDIGVNAPNSGLSVPRSGNSVTQKYYMYFGYPVIASPVPTTDPAVTSPGFLDESSTDSTINTANAADDTGNFSFTTDVTGTYAIIIDTNQDGNFTFGDTLLLGSTTPGVNTVAWNGKNNSGVTVSAGTYNARIYVRLGEYHFIASDAETSGGTEDGLTVMQATSGSTTIVTQVYWDDLTGLPGAGGTTTLTAGAASNTSAGRHTWGNFTGSGFGNERFIDTYVYGRTFFNTTQATVVNTLPNLSFSSTIADDDADNVVSPGQTVTYTVTIDNTGTDTGTGISMTHTLHSRHETLSVTGMTGCGSPTNSSTSTGLNITGITVTAAANCVVTYTAAVKGTVTAGQTIQEIVSVSSAAQGGNGAILTAQTLTVGSPNLTTSTLTDNDADNDVSRNQTVTYTLTVKNTGSVSATGVNLTNTLHSSHQNLSVSSVTNCGSPTNSSTSTGLNVTGATVAVGTDCVIVYTAVVKSTATVGSTLQETVTVGAPSNGGSGGTPSAHLLTVVGANLSTSTLTDNDADNIVQRAQIVTYVGTIKNTGAVTATGVNVTSTLHANHESLTVTGITNCGSPTNSSTSTGLNVTGATVAVGTDCVIVYTAVVKASNVDGTTLQETITVAAAAEGGPGASPSAHLLTVLGPSGGGTPAAPLATSIVINGGDACTATRQVELTLKANDATEALVAGNPYFTGAWWESFSNGMKKPWVLGNADGQHSVWAMFRNVNTQSGAVSDSITLDQAGQCGKLPPAPPAPPAEEPKACVADCTNVAYDLYIVNPNGTERHMGDPKFARVKALSPTLNLISFEDKGTDNDFDDVLIKVDRTDCTRILATSVSVDAVWKHNVRMTILYQGRPIRDLLIWPDSHMGLGTFGKVNANEGDVICKGSPLALEIALPSDMPYLNPNDPATPPPLPSEKVDGPLPGEPLAGEKTTGEPPAANPGPQCSVSCDDITYDLHIVNPNGTERHMGTEYVKTSDLPDGRTLVGFEDSGQDMDHNDIMAILDKRDCANVQIEVLGVSASWHHRVVLSVFHRGRPAFAQLVWNDTHSAGGDVRSVNAKDNPAMCTATTTAASNGGSIPAEESSATPACVLDAPFLTNVPAGSRGEGVVRLQDIMRCLGYFPSDVGSTGVYGFATQQAVLDFQTALGIAPPTGSVGPRTRAALNAYVK